MASFRRCGLPGWILCLPVLALSVGVGRTADNPPPLDAKAVDALVHKTLREVINEGADMYNAKGRYANMDRDYAGCFHFYEGALLVTRPLLAAHPDLQKAIDEALDSARDTPRMEMRAFVLRAAIDKIREAVKGDQPSAPPSPKTLWDRLGGEAGVGQVVDDFVALAAKDQKVNFTRDGKFKLDDAGVKHLKKEVVAFVSSVTGGPLKYEGKTMKDAHKGMEITNDEFDAAVKDLKDALEKNGVKGDDAKTVVAVVETTRKDIVEGKKEPTPPTETKAEGKVVGVDKGKLTATVGEKERIFNVPDAAKVTIDEKEGKLADVKKGSAVVVTSKGDVVFKLEVKSPLPAPQTLWDRLGAEAGVAKVVDDFSAAAIKDPKVNLSRGGKFKMDDDTAKAVKKKVVEFISSVTGGPLKYDGKNMKDAHKGMEITNDEFDAAAKDFQDALEKNGVKADDIKALEKILEDTRKDIVEGKKEPPPPPPPPSETLWDRLGGQPNVAKVVDDFVNTVVKDPKVNFFRDPTVTPTKEQVTDLKKKLVEYVSSATGGPLKYDGKNMKDAHKGMKITDDEFDATVADLKAALEKNGAKADDVKAVLAAVEGTRKEIVEAKKPEDKPKPPEEKKPNDKPAEAGAVSGKVSFKGKPVTGGVVGLTDADGKAVTVKLAADGSYKVETVKVGKYTVTLDTESLNDPAKPNPAYVPIPAAYRDAKTSPLTVEVRKGEQTLDLNLE